MSDGTSATDQKRRANSYDLLRFCAAAAVIVSHHFAISGFAEPPVPVYGEDFGKLAVEVFFTLSGFLICLSLQRTRDPIRFFLARILRVYPNLLAALLSTSLVTMVFFANYGHWKDHLKYVARNLLMFIRDVDYVIPGVFQQSRYPDVNRPLWSLPAEIHMYILLFCLFWIFRQRHWLAAAMIALLALASLPYAMGSNFHYRAFDLYQHSRLACFFFSGALLALFWQRLAPHAPALLALGLLACAAVKYLMPVDSALNGLTLALIVIPLGSLAIFAFFAKGGDASYGMYIYGWPVQQFCILLIPGFWPSLLTALAIATAIGYFTWHLFEKRCMARLSWAASKGHALLRKPIDRENPTA
ncbi:acyltransferase family protein [Aestuariivirga sp.]|uniref:acyltransferase family protein n=1 Tax=Aestuariivirga sp. TaxID=2650926 RepID=UPI0039E39EF8